MVRNQGRFVTALVLVISAVSLSACGKNASQIIQGVAVQTYEREKSHWAEVQTSIDFGSMTPPTFEFPISLPGDEGHPIGTLGMAATAIGKGKVTVAVDLDRALRMQPKGASLPNGSAVPVMSMDLNRIISFTVTKIKAQVYVGFDGQQAVIGVAIPIKEFDGLAGGLGGANLFLPFDFGNDIRGVGGVFTSKNAGGNGIAVFVDGAQIFSPVLSGGSAVAEVGGVSGFQVAQASELQPAQFGFDPSGARAQSTIFRNLGRLSSKRAVLHAK